MNVAVHTVAEADRVEEELLGRLRVHPVLNNIESRPDEQLLELLLQRRFISMIFTPVYDMGIDALTNADALKVAREIVREEYPIDEPSHREYLVDDLTALGATKSQILGCRPTPATTATLVDTLGLMADAATDTTDLRVLAMLRLWGEVVVAVEYGELWNRRIRSQFRSPSRPSVFYKEHYSHDGCEPLSTASSKTHSGRLGICLRDMVSNQSSLSAFIDVETHVIETRLEFYDQFAS